jgi:lipid-binding SYLF domain-containing protein
MRTFGILSLICTVPLLAGTLNDDIKRIDTAGAVFAEIMHAPDGGIPRDLIERAHCVGVIPNMKRAGFIVGAKYGKGVITCRRPGGKWSAPSMVILEGGSIGFQLGVGETDVVFTINNKSGEDRLDQDKFTIGGDAAAMAGPVGRATTAQTDAMMNAEILSWSRARGLFAGVSLEGASLRPDRDDNKALYGRGYTQRELLHGDVQTPEAAHALHRELEGYAPREHTGN